MKPHFILPSWRVERIGFPIAEIPPIPLLRLLRQVSQVAWRIPLSLYTQICITFFLLRLKLKLRRQQRPCNAFVWTFYSGGSVSTQAISRLNKSQPGINRCVNQQWGKWRFKQIFFPFVVLIRLNWLTSKPLGLTGLDC